MPKKSLLILICFSFLLKSLHCQTASSVIDPQEINYDFIGRLFNEKLNELRKSKGLSQLKLDPYLEKAAQEHAKYMTDNDTLTHIQNNTVKKTPSDRVRFFKGNHEGIGENCLFTFLLTPIKDRLKKELITINTYEQAAQDIFTSWKNSPGHYKNMIEPSYDVQGIGFSYNKQKKKLFSSQVFGRFPYTYNKQAEVLLRDYEINPYNAAACEIIKKVGIEGIRVADRIYVSNNQIFLDIENYSKFKKAFLEKYDKIAIDIVFKDQFVCEKNNRLNGSPYFDGLLLEPVTFAEVFKRNRGTYGRLDALICNIPPGLKGMDIQLNVVLIKTNCFCNYTIPVRVDNKIYDLINLQPYWDTIPTYVERDSFNLVIRQKIKFEKGKADITKLSLLRTEQKLKILGWYAKSIKLIAYSSVEGEEQINKNLQAKRAATIIEKLQPYFPKDVQPQISTKENWELFYDQIKKTNFNYLASYPKPRIKEVLRDSLKKEMEDLLEQERYSEFEIPIAGTYHHLSRADILSLGLIQSLGKRNYTLAHAIQSRLILQYLKGEATLDHLSEYSFPDDSVVSPFVVNLLAAKSLNPNSEEYNDTKSLVKLFEKYGANKKAQYNFCVYAINYWALNEDTLIHPTKLFELVKKCAALAPEKSVNSLILNYHLAAVKYYTAINNYELMSSNLYKIHDLFQKTKLDENSSYKLGLYFCSYNMTGWAVELLEPFVNQNKDERFLHLYLTAGVVHYQNNFSKQYIEVLQKYFKLFPVQYNNWIKEEYQLLRYEIFKALYCKEKG
jgi:hypothetical protein